MTDQGDQTLEFKLIRTKEEFEALETEWNHLFDVYGRGTQLFQTFNWIWHWINQFATPPKNLIILTGHKQGELVIAAPLIIDKSFGIKIIKWAGEPVSQYGDILLKDDGINLQWLKQGFNYLVDTLKPDLFYMRKTRFDASITPLLENYGATILNETAAPYIDILGAEDFTEFNKRYSQRSRKAKRRHRRKLEEKGTLSFSLFKEGEAANKAAMHAINLKRQWLKAMRIISPSFKTNLLDNFFNNATKDQHHPVGILVSELCLDERPVAIEIGIRAKDYYGAHIGAYDKEFITHSPGSLQIQDTIAALIKEGLKTIDLFAPADDYKYEWTEQSVPVYDFAYSVSLKGKLYEMLYLNTARPMLKTLVEKASLLKKPTNRELTKTHKDHS